MIISGGFTDNDWSTFPVYAFPITSAIFSSLSGQWMDLSPPIASNTNTATDIELQCNYNDTEAAQDKLYQQAHPKMRLIQPTYHNSRGCVGSAWPAC